MTILGKKRTWILCLGFLLLATSMQANENGHITAQRLADSILVDGQLTETAWSSTSYNSFWQREPDEGKPASEQSEVWVSYDDDALYVAARLHEQDPGNIKGLLGRRDDSLDSDWFWVFVDPFQDKRSGFGFGITPAGSISDCVYFNDNSSDDSWDGIWTSAVHQDDQGWSVEIRIPFNQLRFTRQVNEYRWGIHFRRVIVRKNETADSVFIPRTGSGFVSHFMDLTGISGISPRPLVAISPYLVTKGDFRSGESDQAQANVGLDAKIGLKSNLTLDFTVNPDFGQVEVDPASINLSAAETYYSEKRPFFIEGANIFNNFGYGGSNNHIGANWGSPELFYSRRIGRPPQGQAPGGTLIEPPEWSTILAAGKLTGTLGTGWKFGAIYGLTQREMADFLHEGKTDQVELEPLTHYGVFRVLKEFNTGRQGLGFMGTMVGRNFDAEPLKDQLNSHSISAGLDGWAFLDSGKNWVVSGWMAASRVKGSRDRITSLQQEYPHYFQRPDADHIDFDPQATHLDGWAGRIELNKEKGNFRLNAALGAISPGFDVRDAGFQWGSDVINAHIMLGWRDYTVGKVLRNWSVSAFTQRNYNFGGDKTGEQRLILIANARFLNYWSVYLQTSQNPGHFAQTKTRGGPLMKEAPYQWYDFSVNTDNRKQLVWSMGGFYETSQNGTAFYSLSLSLNWKPSSRFSLSLSPNFENGDYHQQWVTQVDDPAMTATDGTRYIFALMKQKTTSCSLRMNWIFTPRLSLQAYIQPYISVGSYQDFAELRAPRTDDLRVYGNDGSSISRIEDQYRIDPDGSGPLSPFQVGNPDFNYKSLRGTVVLRWEYHPGSSFYFVWTQNRADYADAGHFSLGRDLGHLFSAPGNNVFMIKINHSFNL